MDAHRTQLMTQLNSFDAGVRRAALAQLVELAQGEVVQPAQTAAANMHCHTFFSYNAYGHSPSSLAWLVREQGFVAAGIVDFDVLDAVDEFLGACELIGVRGSAGIETRVFVPEFATREINSPGEPGVAYHMGIGFTASRVADPEAAAILAAMRARAERRNREMLARLNAHLAPVTVDYARDVLPLTPGGNVTERHMLAAIIGKVAHDLTSPAPLSLQERGESGSPLRPGEGPEVRSFWAEKLNVPADQVAAAGDDYAKFSNLVRGKLMKRGGVGYVPPSPEAFPAVEDFHKFILACGALPCFAWLDGTSAGEQAIRELLGLMVAKGVVAVNIIPDRNWNIADPAVKRARLARLYEIVALAAELDLPLNVGTEMNSPGNKLVDDFDAAELAPVRQAFLDGAHFIYGHTIMQRSLGLGYGSAWAATHLPSRRERNAFYMAIGYRVPPGEAGLRQLRAINSHLSPDEILVVLSS